MNAASTRQFFRQTFGDEPDAIGSAPGRVNLIGEHTDYNGGQVLPLAIDRRTWVAMRARPDADTSRIASHNQTARGQVDVRAIARSGKWWDYVGGVLAAFDVSGAGLPQVDVVITSDLPSGSGLSSSAALEMATAITLATLIDDERPLRQLALLAWQVETRFVGVPCGTMDQFASALSKKGHALHLWCDTLETEQVPLSEAVLIFDTNLPRSLRGSQFSERQLECKEALRLLRAKNPELESLAAAGPADIKAARLPRNLEKRALHVATENARVQRLVEILQKSGRVSGDILYESHESLRTLYECSTPELDWFVDEARRIDGVRGARLTGAGWGGCAIAVGEQATLDSAREKLTADYQQAFGRSARTWLTNAEAGARIEERPPG